MDRRRIDYFARRNSTTIDEAAEALLAFSRSFKKVRPRRAKTVQLKRAIKRVPTMKRSLSVHDARRAKGVKLKPVPFLRLYNDHYKSLPDLRSLLADHTLQASLNKLAAAYSHSRKPQVIEKFEVVSGAPKMCVRDVYSRKVSFAFVLCTFTSFLQSSFLVHNVMEDWIFKKRKLEDS